MVNDAHYIGEEIEVGFEEPPILEKKPGCPDSFAWAGTTFKVKEKLKEWTDYRRRGRMARNMRPTHAAIAEQRGSWGVGRIYFRVQTANHRIFDLYFDRAPKDVDRRKGSWILFRELPGQSRE